LHLLLRSCIYSNARWQAVACCRVCCAAHLQQSIAHVCIVSRCVLAPKRVSDSVLHRPACLLLLLVCAATALPAFCCTAVAAATACLSACGAAAALPFLTLVCLISAAVLARACALSCEPPAAASAARCCAATAAAGLPPPLCCSRVHPAAATLLCCRRCSTATRSTYGQRFGLTTRLSVIRHLWRPSWCLTTFLDKNNILTTFKMTGHS
jgi:hypothetical protein